MKNVTIVGSTLGTCVAAIMLAACGVLRQAQDDMQPSIGAPGTTAQGSTIAPARTIVHNMPLAKSYEVLYRFTGGSDGAGPAATLIDVKGMLYGTTASGDGSGCRGGQGCGTVFSTSTSGAEKVLYSFAGGSNNSDGADPEAGLVDVSGTLYGTTGQGGDSGQSCTGGCGTVYSISTAGAETVLYRFTGGSDGLEPDSSLINVNGKLYSVTEAGGSSKCFYKGCGLVYSITTSGSEKVVHHFKGLSASDGASPYSSLINVNGTLYGTTIMGGSGYGTVYSVNTKHVEKVLYIFKSGSDGSFPNARLLNVNGTLYGVTVNGGGSTKCVDACGTVFSVSTSGAEKVLHKFGYGSDGAGPDEGLINVNGTLYGTTYGGGSGSACGSGGCGTVYSISTKGKEKVLYNFAGGSDGANPFTGLLNVNGKLYGTTYYGGGSGCSGGGCGTIFALTP